MSYKILSLQQGSLEWKEFRRQKITASDAPVIMGASKWKNQTKLYREKIFGEEYPVTDRMKRGLDLEPVARDLFFIKTGIAMEPVVILKDDWCMASLDGMNPEKTKIIEIKCAGNNDHSIALSGKVPDHYFPQLQHELYVTDLEEVVYFSFDGLEGVSVPVYRDEKFIKMMVQKELEFYECLISKKEPVIEDEYVHRDDYEWIQAAENWKLASQKLKQLEKEEEEARKHLIDLSKGLNSRGGGISLCQVTRKGTVDYSMIPELKQIDLEKYRKPVSSSWRITA